MTVSLTDKIVFPSSVFDTFTAVSPVRDGSSSATVSTNTAVVGTPISTYTGVMTVAALGDSIMYNGSLANPQSYITGITNANPGSVTTGTVHGLTTGDVVYISMVQGMSQINDATYTVTVTSTTTFTIGVDTTSWGVFSGSQAIVHKTTGVQTVYDRSYWSMPSGILGARFAFHPRWNKGIVGDTSAGVMSRLATSLPTATAGKYNTVLLSVGTNDITAGTAPATVVSNVQSIISDLQTRLGVTYVILVTPPPRDADTAPNKANKITLVNSYKALETSSVIVVDAYAALDNGSGSYKTGCSTDGIHPNTKAAQLVTDAFYSKLLAKFGRKAWALDAGNILTTTDMSGTGGSATPTVFTNSGTATGLTASLSSGTSTTTFRTLSKDTDGKQLYNINPLTTFLATERVQFAFSVSSGFTTGNWYIAQWEIEMTSQSGSGTFTQLYAELRNNAAQLAIGNNIASGQGPYDKATFQTQTSGKKIIIQTPAAQLPTGSTSISTRLYISHDLSAATCNDTFKLHNCQIFSVPNPYA